MKYSTAAFTFALALLAANNDVADAGGFNLRGRGAINRRRARHLKGNQDTTGDDALNRATPTVAKEDDIIITDDTDIVGEESVTSVKSKTTVDGVDDEAITEGASDGALERFLGDGSVLVAVPWEWARRLLGSRSILLLRGTALILPGQLCHIAAEVCA